MSTTPSTFRKKPVTIEAIQLAVEPAYDDEAGRAAAQAYHDEIAEWINAGGGDANAGVNYVEIDTLEGVMTASPEDWIIRGVAGEYYPCKPDIFEATYEPADQTRPTDDQSGSRAHVQDRVTTAAELDALPVGSVAVLADQTVIERAGLDFWLATGQTIVIWHKTVQKHVADLTIIRRPGRDLIAEAEARGAREFAAWASSRLGENQSIREGDVKEWLLGVATEYGYRARAEETGDGA